MKKLLLIFVVLCALIIGMELGAPSSDTKNKEIQDRIEDFEGKITTPGNKYIPGEDNKDVNPNITNNLAKTGEKAITGIFDFAFSLIESAVNKN